MKTVKTYHKQFFQIGMKFGNVINVHSWLVIITMYYMHTVDCNLVVTSYLYLITFMIFLYHSGRSYLESLAIVLVAV